MYYYIDPLFVKVPMKRENYIKLLKEAIHPLGKTYLRKYFYHSEGIFVMDNPDIACPERESFIELELIAKYAEPTDRCAGFLHSGDGCEDLHFVNGKFEQVRSTYFHENGNKSDTYKRHKDELLRGYPILRRKRNPDPEVYELLWEKVTFSEKRCVCVSNDALDMIFLESGHPMKEVCVDFDDVAIYLLDEDEDGYKDPEQIIAEYFGYDHAHVFRCCASGHSNDHMILLLNDDEENSGIEQGCEM